MRKILSALFLGVLLVSCGETTNPQLPPPDPVTSNWKDTDSGWLLLSLSNAYSQWEETNKLPNVVNWCGVDIYVGEYVQAGITLALKIIDHPADWMTGSLEYPHATFGLNSTQPFIPQEVPFSAFVQLLRNQYKSMSEKGEVILNMQIPGYEPTLSTKGLAVMLCHAFAIFEEKGVFPETINTWESSYTHATSNCNPAAPEVVAARDAAWARAGVTAASTDREKAVAIFNYARDEWTWEDYMNTRKGAVGTINAKGGNCCDLSHAVLAMARLSGIPGRYFHAQCHYSSGYIGHVVSQLFVDGQWNMADASNDGNSFGTVKFTDYTSLHYYEELDF